MQPVQVLIVDDDESDYLIAAGMLGQQQLTSFEVEHAATFEAGAEAIRARRHDVYLVDHRLGARTGLELVRQAFAEGGPAPVLILTGYDDEVVDRDASELGATEFLLKDQLEPRLLERSIRYAISQHRVLAELQRSEAECVAARIAAEQANQAKDHFLSRATHELRTPLTAVLGYSELLDREALEPNARECLDEIVRGGKHLRGLIDEVLDLSNIESGGSDISVAPVQLTHVVADALAMIRPLADEVGVRLKVGSIELFTAHVQADDRRLRQVLLNLLSNAVKYNEAGGTVTIASRGSTADQVEILVSDDGRGMTEEQLKKLYTPFDRLGLEQSEIEGTGLGMAVSLRLLEAMGGSMDVWSEAGVGTTACIQLALASSKQASASMAADRQLGSSGFLDSLDNGLVPAGSVGGGAGVRPAIPARTRRFR